MGNATDDALLVGLHDAFAKHPSYKKPLRAGNKCFVIHHYAGPVSFPLLSNPCLALLRQTWYGFSS